MSILLYMEFTTTPEAQMFTTAVNDDMQTWWDSDSRKSPYSTVCDPSDDTYCESCDQDVDYSDGSKHGKCGCDS